MNNLHQQRKRIGRLVAVLALISTASLSISAQTRLEFPRVDTARPQGANNEKLIEAPALKPEQEKVSATSRSGDAPGVEAPAVFAQTDVSNPVLSPQAYPMNAVIHERKSRWRLFTEDPLGWFFGLFFHLHGPLFE